MTSFTPPIRVKDVIEMMDSMPNEIVGVGFTYSDILNIEIKSATLLQSSIWLFFPSLLYSKVERKYKRYIHFQRVEGIKNKLK